MEDVWDFIAKLQDGGVHLRLDGEQLKYTAQPGVVTPAHIEKIRARKQQIVAALKQREQPASQSAIPALVASDSPGPFQISFLQRSMVESYPRTEPLAQHSMVIRRLRFPVDVAALRKSISCVVARHAALRSRYVRLADGSRAALTDPPAAIVLQTYAVEEPSLGAKEARTRALIAQVRAPRFDLEKGPLVRAALITLAEDDHALAVVIHHSVVDAWSLGIVTGELFALYAAYSKGAEPKLPDPPLRFYDYTAWVKALLASDAGRAQRTYWREKARGVDNPFWLPRDALAVPSERIRSHGLQLDSRGLEPLRELAKRERTTVAAVVLTAYGAALARWSDRSEALIAVLHFGRQQAQVLGVVGLFVDAWLLRLRAGADRSFAEMLRDVRAATAEAQERIHVPLHEVREQLAAHSDESPLLHITFNYLRMGKRQQPTAESLAIEEFPMDSELEPLDEGRREKLVVYFTEDDDSLAGKVRYSPKRFSEATIEAFWADMEVLLAAAGSRERVAEPLPPRAKPQR